MGHRTKQPQNIMYLRRAFEEEEGERENRGLQQSHNACYTGIELSKNKLNESQKIPTISVILEYSAVWVKLTHLCLF